MVEIPSEYNDGATRKGKRVKVTYWEESFDAVVVGTTAESDAPWVPSIPNLDQWAERFPESVYHSRSYRRPDDMKGKVRACFPLRLGYKKDTPDPIPTFGMNRESSSSEEGFLLLASRTIFIKGEEKCGLAHAG